MTSTSDKTHAPELTEAVLILQTIVRKFIKDVESKRQNIFQNTPHDLALSGGLAIVTSLSAAADEETKTHLESLLEETLRLERQLRAIGKWHPPSKPWDAPFPTALDFEDLSSATRVLRHMIASTASANQRTPQQTLSAYSWTWDPAWREFYTFLPTQNAYIYLSQWKLNEARGVWEHVSMTGTNLMPNDAAEKLGAWEDWKWDAVAGQWYLDMGSESGEQVQIFASPWQIQEDGEWVYVGTIGSIE